MVAEPNIVIGCEDGLVQRKLCVILAILTHYVCYNLWCDEFVSYIPGHDKFGCICFAIRGFCVMGKESCLRVITLQFLVVCHATVPIRR